MINWGSVPIGAVLPFPFASYGKTNGESITLTGLAITDVEIYKGITVTQRASDAGVVLIDTDGIDVDGTTGIHGFSIDTGDDTDAGFFVAGSYYWVVVSAVTIDSQTVNFIAGTFHLRVAEAVAGVPTVNADYISGDQAAAAALEVAYDGTAGPVPEHGITDQGTAQSATSTTLVLRAAASFADDVPIGSTLLAFGSTQGYWQVRVITDYVLSTDTATVDAWAVTPSGTITYKVFGSAAGQGVAQTGDAYAVVASGTHGNAALKTLVDDLPTNAELATSQASADDATLAAIAAIGGIAQTGDAYAVVANPSHGNAALKVIADNIPTNAELTAAIDAALTATVADSIPADGSRPSLSQAAYLITQYLLERSVTGTTATIKKPDGTTTLLTQTLNSATAPTSVTRAT